MIPIHSLVLCTYSFSLYYFDGHLVKSICFVHSLGVSGHIDDNYGFLVNWYYCLQPFMNLSSSLVLWHATSHVGGMTYLSHQSGTLRWYNVSGYTLNMTYGEHVYYYLSDMCSPTYYLVGVFNLKKY